ncbi:protein FAM53B [Alosa pseudoharengus]|uniref:protein FAM53B n=1 Tax=Alosa pseudoharengus TaxID=34774 RepID=UPI003F89A1C7
MCVVMVIIQAKTLEKKGADDVTSKDSNFELCEPVTMSQGAALFSCGIMESSRWCEMGRGCGIQQRPVGSSLESLWDALPESCQSLTATPWGTSGTISNLLQDLSLSESSPAHALSTAPPSKRQCRSLSCSDELAAGCRSPWRPQGSRVWTAVEKRRCHSGGSVAQRTGHSGAAAGASSSFPGMQRSSSFSLPTRSNGLELPCFGGSLAFPSAFTGLLASPTSPSSSSSSPSKPPCPLYLSHEQICLPEPQGRVEACSSSDSTPELGRRSGQSGLARSRSQPCVLNDKKIGVKRRRPADSHKQRPSLDLAKMTQKLRNFHSLSCPGITGEDASPVPPTLSSSHQYETAFASVGDQGEEPRCRSEGQCHAEDDSSADDQDADPPGCGHLNSGTTNGKEREPLWAGLCESRRDVYQLGGELDIEQIERN